MNRSRLGVAALGVAAATLAGAALHTTAHPHITARDQASALFANRYEVIGAAGTVEATVPFLVAPGIQEPPTPCE